MIYKKKEDRWSQTKREGGESPRDRGRWLQAEERERKRDRES